MSGTSIKEQNLTGAYELVTVSNNQSNQARGNQICTGDMINLISGSNGVDPLSISDTWRGIVEDLYGM